MIGKIHLNFHTWVSKAFQSAFISHEILIILAHKSLVGHVPLDCFTTETNTNKSVSLFDSFVSIIILQPNWFSLQNEKHIERERERDRLTPKSWYMFTWNWINNATHLIGVILMDLSIVEAFNFICYFYPSCVFFSLLRIVQIIDYRQSRAGVMPPSAHHRIIKFLCNHVSLFVGFPNRIIVSFFTHFFFVCLVWNRFMYHGDSVGHQIQKWMHFSHLDGIVSIKLSLSLNSLVIWPNCISTIDQQNTANAIEKKNERHFRWKFVSKICWAFNLIAAICWHNNGFQLNLMENVMIVFRVFGQQLPLLEWIRAFEIYQCLKGILLSGCWINDLWKKTVFLPTEECIFLSFSNANTTRQEVICSMQIKWMAACKCKTTNKQMNIVWNRWRC